MIDFAFNTGPDWIRTDYKNGDGGKFFLKFLKDKNIEKRRIGEMILFEKGKFIHFDEIKGKASQGIKNLIKDYMVPTIDWIKKKIDFYS
jgi:IS4 transposase